MLIRHDVCGKHFLSEEVKYTVDLIDILLSYEVVFLLYLIDWFNCWHTESKVMASILIHFLM